MPCAECSGAERCIDRRARELLRREAVQSSAERRRAVEERCCTARGAEWCGRCQFEALRGSSGGDVEARGQAQGRAPARWLCMSLGPKGPIVHAVMGESRASGDTSRELRLGCRCAARLSSASKDWCRLDRPRWGGGASYVRIHRGPPGAMVAARPVPDVGRRAPARGSKDSVKFSSKLRPSASCSGLPY